MHKCVVCSQNKVWAVKKILDAYVCTDCLGHCAYVAREIGVLEVRERLDSENLIDFVIAEQAVISNNGGS